MHDEGNAMSGDRPSPSEKLSGGPLAVEISNRMSHLFSEYTGRGATRIRTHVHDDLIVTVLYDTLTKGERRMAELGEMDVVVSTRRSYQRLMKTDLSAMITELTGRKVHAFLSDQSADPDVAVEAFVLEHADAV
jgi:uncharacterized protein YbcI